MTRYTQRRLIHDARIFDQPRLEYRRSNDNRRKDLLADGVLRYLAGVTRRGRA